MRIKFTTSENERFNRENSMIQRKKIMSLYQFLLKASQNNGELFKSLNLSLNQLLEMLTKSGKEKNISRASLYARIKKLELLELLKIDSKAGQSSAIYTFERIKTEEILEEKTHYIDPVDNEFNSNEEFFGTYSLDEMNCYLDSVSEKQDKKQDSSNTYSTADENIYNDTELNNIILFNKNKSFTYTSSEAENYLEAKGIDYNNYIENSLEKVRDFSIIENHFKKAIKILRLRKGSRAYEEVLNNLKNNYYNITVKYAFNYVLKVIESVKVKYQLAREEFAKKVIAAKKLKKHLEIIDFRGTSRFLNHQQRDYDYNILEKKVLGWDNE